MLNNVNEAGNLQTFGLQFWNEKRIPRWLRYGAASYVERFLPNPEVTGTDSGADPWDLRSFALAELDKNGGLRELPHVFAFALSLEDIPGSIQRYIEAGLLVSFLLDGSQDDSELQGLLDALRATLPAGSQDEVRAAASALEAALTERTDAIRAYAAQ